MEKKPTLSHVGHQPMCRLGMDGVFLSANFAQCITDHHWIGPAGFLVKGLNR
jgi:hypothetical protein